MMGAMGQVIAFPGSKSERKVEITEDRRHAFITGLCALTFLLGFFIIGPSLALFAFGFATTAHIASCALCVAGLAVTWALTRVAYKHL
jgi:hypothetical protein